MYKNNTKKHRGFTLVETLVAISILTMSIASSFAAVQNGLQSSIYAKDKITAFYLTQEAMEYIKNIRDENALHFNNWLTGISSVGSDPCYFGKVCHIDSSVKQVYEDIAGLGSSPYIRRDPVTSLLGYNNAWTVTNFRREVKITSISVNEISVTVYISWLTNKGVVKSFQVNELLFNQ